MMMYGGEQDQPLHQYTPIVPFVLQGQDVGFEATMHSNHNNNNNFMMVFEGEQNQQQQHHGVHLGFQGLENWLMLDMNVDDYFNIDGVLNTEGGTTQEHGQEEEAQEQPQQLTPLP
ncbi:unnamed protein product [Microthlaspi erraticum]|uniref:Uncharacterized protein n=1 Tax=Microthlaspi erraticum TaxID=1685480 RepID=A0A6D2IUY0_9BRAS|nr:unnamed protein product [Microthlaspi erraticum]